MSISKRKNGTYNVEVYIDGKRVAMKRGFRNKTEAKIYHDEVKSKHRQDPLTTALNDYTFDQLILPYLTETVSRSKTFASWVVMLTCPQL